MRDDIDFAGATGEYLDLLEKTVAVSAHAHYLRAPLPGSRVGRADRKLQDADPDAVVLLSSWLRGQMEHLEPRDIVAAREKREAEAAAAREQETRLEREAVQAAVAARAPDPWERPGQYGDDTPF